MTRGVSPELVPAPGRHGKVTLPYHLTQASAPGVHPREEAEDFESQIICGYRRDSCVSSGLGGSVL